MKRKTLEFTVLVLGLIIIGIALFLMFFTETSYSSLFITNIVFALGFLIYIIYTIMNTNSLNRDIKALNQHVATLKATIKEKNHQLEERQRRIEELQEAEQKLTSDLEAAHAKAEGLALELSEIKSSRQKP